MYDEAEAKRDAARAAGTEDTSSHAYHAAMESPLLFDASMESANLLKAVQVRPLPSPGCSQCGGFVCLQWA